MSSYAEAGVGLWSNAGGSFALRDTSFTSNVATFEKTDTDVDGYFTLNLKGQTGIIKVSELSSAINYLKKVG